MVEYKFTLKENIARCKKMGAVSYTHLNLYAVMKEILRLREGLILGGVRAPLPGLGPEDLSLIHI